MFLKVTPVNYMRADWGEATPESFFGKLIAEFGAERIAWGSNFPVTAGTLKDNLAAGPKRSGITPCSRSGVGVRQDRAGALPVAGGTKRSGHGGTGHGSTASLGTSP